MKIPFGFARCYQERCPLKENCLRYYSAQHEESEANSVLIVNPRLIPEDASKCAYYKGMKKIRVAWGLKHLFDEVPAKQLYSLRSGIIASIGRTRYYRCYRMEQGLTPADQQIIASAFRKYGLTIKPNYDHFTEVYDWG